ncbi:hypothetical protein [Sinomonas sp. ASV322]|uniref:hypothetical protein n=1 Tax=Sinomonas sp. ASV322 TaxID=3041920 RepID=UPI0027DCC021|nr:hypothetical protein [Sinomonas sp. ASV322]MDQ4503383.1 hypothetical protein [Sinomonas sp. ASV322]
MNISGLADVLVWLFTAVIGSLAFVVLVVATVAALLLVSGAVVVGRRIRRGLGDPLRAARNPEPAQRHERTAIVPRGRARHSLKW